jgi:ribonuclease HI
MPDYILVFDGGSRGNPGAAYGSFRLHRRGARPGLPTRLRFGRGTNNEAEYWSLIAGLESLLVVLSETGISPQEVRLEVRGDSQLVIRQVEGSWKAKEKRMRQLRDRTLNLLRRFAAVSLIHQDRARSLAVLGH